MTPDPTPMFPLGSVLLPHNALPLHVFEPRYRQMIETVLDGDRCFGVVLIERGSEVGGDDVRTEVGCLAEIREIQQMEDGRYALIAVGTERFRVTSWLPDAPHPWALLEPFPHDGPDPDSDAADGLQHQLRRALALCAELGEPAAPATIELEAPPDVVVDIVASLAPIGPLDKYELLRCESRAGRGERLAAMLTDEIELLEARIQLR